jgi:hypothetical protein
MDNQEDETIEFQNAVINDLRNNEKYKSYFSKFNPLCIESFITGFAHTKLMYTRYADMFRNQKERADLGMFPEAFKRLAEIQQKKLFDMQCLWRAGKVELEGITNTFHFDYWEQYIFACPFIEPITEADIDLYMKYLSSSYEDPSNWLSDYQDYEGFKEAIESDDGGVYPDWYEFYDTYRGTGMNIKLPDIKGERQEFYRGLCFDDKKEEEIKAGTYKPYNPSNQLPYLSSLDDNQIEEFIHLFESSKEFGLWKNYSDSKNNNSDEFDDAVFFLADARELIPIESHLDYREAIIKSAQLYKNRLLARALPLAFEEYQMKLDVGISFYDNLPPIDEDDNGTRVNEQIIKGRILNGEPPDFNF